MTLQIENEFISLECMVEAGQMKHLINKRNGKEILYQGNQGWTGRNPSLFPIIGNTFDGTYTIQGKTYAMKNHGLIRYMDLDGQVENDSIVFTTSSNEETLKQYPFEFDYKMTYRLDQNKVIVNYEITNTGKDDMPFSFGLHPAFRLEDSFDSYSIRFEHQEHMKQLVFEPSVELREVTMDAWTLSREDLDRYKTLVFEQFTSKYVDLVHQDQAILRMHFDGYPFLAFWSHPEASDFICIEPWIGHADYEDVNEDFYHREGTIVLKPQKTFEIRYEIEIMEE